MATSPNDCMTAAEAAAECEARGEPCTKQAIGEACRKGRLRARQSGSTWVFLRRDFEEWLAARRARRGRPSEDR